MPKHRLRRPGVCIAAAIAFGSLVSATPGLADPSPDLTVGLPSKASAAVADALPSKTVQTEAAPVAADPAEPPVDPPADLGAVEPVEQPYEPIGEGEASYYGYELAGNRTASGERFNPKALTAAHRTLPLGTRLRVTNKSNGKSVVVRINDRGPFVKRRLIDVSLGAAQQINMVRAGKAQVLLERLR
jgi:rare lipoprotein A